MDYCVPCQNIIANFDLHIEFSHRDDSEIYSRNCSMHNRLEVWYKSLETCSEKLTPNINYDALQEAFFEYRLRKYLWSTPAGTYTSKDKWFPYPDECRECCRNLAHPKPHKLLKGQITYPGVNLRAHCLTYTHISNLYGVSKKDLIEMDRSFKITGNIDTYINDYNPKAIKAKNQAKKYREAVMLSYKEKRAREKAEEEKILSELNKMANSVNELAISISKIKFS